MGRLVGGGQADGTADAYYLGHLQRRALDAGALEHGVGAVAAGGAGHPLDQALAAHVHGIEAELATKPQAAFVDVGDDHPGGA